MTPAWISVAERLWGRGWIAPLSEVLRVNRRTVERWASGAVAIPAPVATMIEAIKDVDVDPRAYGLVLRWVAEGATEEEATARAATLGAALEQLHRAAEDGDPVVSLAFGRRK